MKIIITNWSLDSYLNLKHERAFTVSEYKNILRPDVELLKSYTLTRHPKFSHSKFWGPATGLNGNVIQFGYKMKWHNIGFGRVQLRLAVVIYEGTVFLCQGYVKSNEHKDKREMAKLKNRIADIKLGSFTQRGFL